MATSNLGTSTGLQGNYKNDYLENLQLQEQKRKNLTDEAFRQQQAEDKQKQLAREAISDAVSIPKGRFLPQRDEELKNETVDLMTYVTNKSSLNPSYNPQNDSDFQKKKLDLMFKAKSYETERQRAEKDVDEMVRNADIYDKRGIEEGLSVLNGNQPFSESMKGKLYQVPKVKDFSKYTNIEPYIDSSNVFDTLNESKEVILPNGERRVYAAGGYDFTSPEKEAEQVNNAIKHVEENRNNPYIQKIISEKEKEVIESAPSKGIVIEQLPDDVFNGMVNNLVAAELVKKAKNSEENKSKYVEKPAPRPPSGGLNLNFNGSGGGSSSVYNIDKYESKPLYRVEDGKKTDKVIGNYTPYSVQTKAAGENAKKLNIAGYNDVQVEQVQVNDETGKPEYFDIVIPARTGKRGKIIPSQKKVVKVTDKEVENFRTNIGSKFYDGTIGSQKPMKSESDKEVKYNDDDVVKIKINGKEYTQTVGALRKKGYKDSEFIK